MSPAARGACSGSTRDRYVLPIGCGDRARSSARGLESVRPLISSGLLYDVVLGGASVFTPGLTHSGMHQVSPHIGRGGMLAETRPAQILMEVEPTLSASLPLSYDRLLGWVEEGLGARSGFRDAARRDKRWE